MNSPLVSIIIPVFNVKAYIERCLLSVYKQTYANIEVLLIDDCGEDNSASIAEQFIQDRQWNKARIIFHVENKGLSAARNTGIKHAKGDYVYFLDSDDEITSDCIEKLVTLALNFKSKFVQGNFKSLPYNWFRSNINLTLDSKVVSHKQQVVQYIFSRAHMPPMACNRLINRDVIVDNNLFFKEGIYHEDEHWNFFIVNYITKIVICSEPTYLYYKNIGGITLSENNKIKLKESWKIILQDWVALLDFPYKKQKIAKICEASYENYLNSSCTDFEFIKILRPLDKTVMIYNILKVCQYLFIKRIIPASLQLLVVRGAYRIFKLS